MTIVGLKPYGFTTNDGKEMKGVSIFVTYEDENKKTIGIIADKISITEENLGNTVLSVGMEIEPMYNKYGKVQSIATLKVK